MPTCSIRRRAMCSIVMNHILRRGARGRKRREALPHLNYRSPEPHAPYSHTLRPEQLRLIVIHHAPI